MAHFAKIENNVVVQVLVVDNKDIQDENGDEQESLGQLFLNELLSEATWVQTSYNHNFRKQYAGIGYTYDSVKEKFIKSQPYPSWSLDDNDDWQAPVPYPDDADINGGDKVYDWDEETTSWVEVKFE